MDKDTGEDAVVAAIQALVILRTIYETKAREPQLGPPEKTRIYPLDLIGGINKLLGRLYNIESYDGGDTAEEEPRP